MARLRRRRGPLGFLRSLNTLAYLPLASRAPTYGRLVYALLRDDRIAWSKKAVLAVAAGYVVSPIDFVPEMIPILGALDDVAVIVLALDIFLESVPRTLLNEKLAELDIDPAELEHDLEQVRRYVPKPIRRLAMRLPGAIDSIGSAVKRSGLDRRVREWIDQDETERVRRARPVGSKRSTATKSSSTARTAAKSSRPGAAA
jgi:uncharacterized membrane protein YkvA (DUF1232 family)